MFQRKSVEEILSVAPLSPANFILFRSIFVFIEIQVWSLNPSN